MISRQEWATLINLTEDDFKHPYGLQFPIVQALDRFITMVGARPIILSDYREGDPRQHGFGNAIDTTWPGQNGLTIWASARASLLFTGIGIYFNELGVVSFHFDVRLDRTAHDPATWGAFVTHPLDPRSGNHVQKNEYTTATAIIDVIKKKGMPELLISIALIFAAYQLMKK